MDAGRWSSLLDSTLPWIDLKYSESQNVMDIPDPNKNMMRHDQPVHVAIYTIWKASMFLFMAWFMAASRPASSSQTWVQRISVEYCSQPSFFFGVHGKGVRNQEPSRATPVTPCDNTKRDKKSFGLLWLLWHYDTTWSTCSIGIKWWAVHLRLL